MFTDIKIARRHAFNLAQTLMVITMVIATGSHFAVITAEDHDGRVTVLNEYDPFG